MSGEDFNKIAFPQSASAEYSDIRKENIWVGAYCNVFINVFILNIPTWEVFCVYTYSKLQNSHKKHNWQYSKEEMFYLISCKKRHQNSNSFLQIA